MKIVVASSDPYLSGVLCCSLSGLGAVVEPVANEEEFCRICLAGRCEVAVTLFLAPFLNGFDLGRRLRESVLRPPALFVLSWLHDEQTVMSLYESGIDQYFTLPFSVARLRGKVATQLYSRGL